jgi:hypothetical protein
MKKSIAVIAVAASALFLCGWSPDRREPIALSERPSDVDVREWALYNYREDAEKASVMYGVPFEFIMALVVLECDGNKPSGFRFESHVYSKLKAVAGGKSKRYGAIRGADIAECGEDIRDLATSHGPLQIMGYHAVGMGICVSELAGDSSIYKAARWMSESPAYMELLAANRFTDAFHLHNTGKVKPKKGSRTHDPNYCRDGLSLLRWFRSNKEITNPTLTAR